MTPTSFKRWSAFCQVMLGLLAFYNMILLQKLSLYAIVLQSQSDDIGELSALCQKTDTKERWSVVAKCAQTLLTPPPEMNRAVRLIDLLTPFPSVKDFYAMKLEAYDRRMSRIEAYDRMRFRRNNKSALGDDGSGSAKNFSTAPCASNASFRISCSHLDRRGCLNAGWISCPEVRRLSKTTWD